MGESSARLLATSLCSGLDGAACLRSAVLEAAAEVVALRFNVSQILVLFVVSSQGRGEAETLHSAPQCP